MSVIDFLNSLFFMPEEPVSSEMAEEEEEVLTDEPEQVNADQIMPDCHVGLYSPRTVEEGSLIAEFLRSENHAAVVNLNRMRSEEAQQLLDFLNGALFMIRGSVKEIGYNVFLCTYSADMARKEGMS